MTDRQSPSVTLGLIAYNQDRYVRSAIDAALAQQCSSMELILSDDCSSDGTYAIMQEMAASYRGPHVVRTRREPLNVGTVQHLINVARAAKGQLLVMAAGDDISYPDRAATLHAAWLETGAAALASRHDEIDANGTTLNKDCRFAPPGITQIIFADEPQAHRIDGKIQTVPGFCAAYPRKFWADMPDPPCKLLVEDGMASALIILRGGLIHQVPRTLMAYRLLDSSLTVRAGGFSVVDVRERERKIDDRARALVAETAYVLDVIRNERLPIRPRTLAWFHKARNHGALMADFWRIAPPRRLLRIARVRTRYDAAFLLPRLLGFRLFAAGRALMKRQAQ